MSDTVGDQPKPDDSIRFADFLESKPPGSRWKISDLMMIERYQSGGTAWKLNNPRLHLHCQSDECSDLRYFRFEDGDRQVEENGELQTFLTYRCSNCRRTTKMFALFVAAGAKPAISGESYKYGEMPPFGPITPPRLLKMIGHNRDLFMKGRRCESQGLGIGAFVYIGGWSKINALQSSEKSSEWQG